MADAARKGDAARYVYQTRCGLVDVLPSHHESSPAKLSGCWGLSRRPWSSEPTPASPRDRSGACWPAGSLRAPELYAR